MREAVLHELVGRLWHTTHPDRFERILKTGAILPEPDIPDKERWKTAEGPKYYPYARVLGAVSLFDFRGFEHENYGEKYPLSSWQEFVPYQESSGEAVWIEIDREKIAARFISGPDLVLRWKADDAYEHTIMPDIEAAHLGPLPVNAFKRAFLVGKQDTQFHPLACECRQ